MTTHDSAARSLIAFAVLLTASPWAQAQCLTSAVAWQNTSIASQSSTFQATFDATPNTAKMDGVTGLSLGSASGYPSVAAIVRFNETGTIDVRNGSAYAAATPVSYAVGSKYHFVMTVNPTAHTYSVTVTPPGASAITLATNYAFRTEQAATSSLNSWALESDVGTHQVCNFALVAAAPPPDTTPPTVSIKAPVSGASVSGTLAISGTAADNVGVVSVAVSVDAGASAPASGITAWSYSFNTASLTNGTHTITAQAKDAAGNVGTASVSVTVNNAPPPTPGCLTASTAWQNASFTSQITPFTASFSATPGIADMDGVTGLSLGNASAFTSLAVAVRFNNTGFIDARNAGAYAAVTSIPYTAGAAYLFNLTVIPAAHTYSATVTPPGAAAITLATNYAFRTEQAATASLNDWAIYADAGSHQVCNFAIGGPPTTPPTVSIAAPAAGAALSGTATISGTAADNLGVASVALSVDGGIYNPCTGTTAWSCSLNTAGLASGSHTLTVQGKDPAGNLGTASVTVTVPPVIIPPTVTIRSPASGATLSGTATISGTAASAAGIASASLSVDAGVYAPCSGTTNWSCSLITTGLSNAIHSLTVQVKDTAGTASSAVVSVNVSNTAAASSYNQTILGDKPVMFLAMSTPGSGTETDLSGNGNNGTYVGGAPPLVSMPNGDQVADFNGSSEYVTVNSVAALSVPTSGIITIESWVKPDTLQFPNSESSGYVYWQGKGNATAGYEYANRMYSLVNSESRPNRMSDYAWNTTGSLGSGAYFQDVETTTNWIMVTDIIDMKDTSSAYPTGYISIYKNGVLRDTVPLNQYNVVPAATSAPYRIGTRDNNSYFEGAIGKVAVYNYALSAAQITNHYAAMKAP